MMFVAPNLAWGEARGASARAPEHPRQWGCDRRATKPQAKFGATLRAAVLFGPGGVARSLQIHGRDMRVARALPGPKTPRRKRHRIYALDHLGSKSSMAPGETPALRRSIAFHRRKRRGRKKVVPIRNRDSLSLRSVAANLER